MSLEPTRPRLLAMLAVPATAFGWGLARVWETATGRLLPVPWTAAAALLVLALGLLLWAIGVRRRLADARRVDTAPVTVGRLRPLDPLVAARTAALAMAASRTGALVGGFYLGVALAFAGAWASEPSRQRVLAAGAAVLGAVLVVAAALWLERICRLPGPPDGADGGGRGTDDGSESRPAWGHPRAAG